MEFIIIRLLYYLPMERMAMKWNLEMGQEFFMEIWNGYERSKELEEENQKLNDYWNITQRTMKDYEDTIDGINDKLNKIKDLFNKRDMTWKDEFLEELRDLLRD